MASGTASTACPGCPAPRDTPVCCLWAANILTMMLAIANCHRMQTKGKQNLVNWVKCSTEIESKSKSKVMAGHRSLRETKNAINIEI